MAIPSGSGSEVLKRTTIKAQSNTATAFRWDGTMATTGTSSYTVPALHIITVLSVGITEMDGTSELFHMAVNNGSTDIYLIYNQPIINHDAFVYSDKIVLQAGDKLWLNMASTGSSDCYCSYIDQDWT